MNPCSSRSFRLRESVGRHQGPLPFERGSAGQAATDYDIDHQRKEQLQWEERKRRDTKAMDPRLFDFEECPRELESNLRATGGKSVDEDTTRGRIGGQERFRKDGKVNDETSNDWSCPACNAENFARRSECFRCKAQRQCRSRSREHYPRKAAVVGKGEGKSSCKGCGGKSGGKACGAVVGGGNSAVDKKEDSRSLIQQGRARSPSSGSGTSRSSSKPRTTQQRMPRSGLWDSTEPTFEAAPKQPTARPGRQPMELGVGARVDLFGLVGAPQYNGSEGRIVDGPNDKGRFTVLIESTEGKTLALLPINLRVKPSCGWEVIAAGLSNLATDWDVAQTLGRCGRVKSAKVTRDMDGESKGVALVEMMTREGAERAMEMEEELTVLSRPIKVKWSTMATQELGLLQTRRDVQAEEAKNPRRKFQEDVGGSNAAAALEFTVGRRLTISGLVGAPQYNGTIGMVQGHRHDGRLMVLVRDPRSGEEKTLALKAENLADATIAETTSFASPPGGHSGAGEITGCASPPMAPATGVVKAVSTLPPYESMLSMSAKELKQLLLEHGVDVSDCREKCDFLDEAKKLR